LDRFNEYQERRGLLATTIRTRGLIIQSLSRHLNDLSLLSATREDIEGFLAQTPICAATRCCYLSHISSFFRWAIVEELAETDPTIRMERPKQRRRLPRPASSDQLAEALKVAAPRDRCWVLLAAYQGLRCQEIAGLDWADIEEEKRLLRVVRGKGARERLLPLHPDVALALRCLPRPHLGIVFRRPLGGPYTPTQMSAAFNRVLRDLGVDAAAHQLRHWFATNLYANTQDIRVTQEMLGHASPETTAIYTQFSNKAAARGIVSLNLEEAI
jgi:integrase/recombinase XerC